MKFALVDRERREAQPGLSGECPVCGSALVAKCGELRVWHWAHRGVRTCDHWWEPETEWHRAWKGEFLSEWQEVLHWAEDGEKHIADVKTEHGRVIEFQHSYIRAAERRAREDFYGRMVWVVDGLRRERDKPKFDQAVRNTRIVLLKPLTFRIPSGECSLLRDWIDSGVPVLLDFREPVLWHLYPKSPDAFALLTPVWRADFVNGFRTGVGYKGIDANVAKPAPLPKRPRTGLKNYVARGHRVRSRRM